MKRKRRDDRYILRLHLSGKEVKDMKQINKRTLAWSMLTAGVLSVTVLPDHYMFVNSETKQVVATVGKTESGKEVLKLLLTGEEENSWKYSTGAGEIFFEEADVTSDSVLANITEESQGKAGVATLEAKNVPVVTAAWESPWNGKALVIAESQTNVYAQASEEAELVGKVTWANEAQIVEDGTEWVKISSGNVNGYMRKQFLACGTQAEELADALGQKIATVQADGLFVRRSPDENGEVCDQAEAGDKYNYQTIENGWVSISLASGKTGYVSEQYVTTEVVYSHGITVEEEQAAILAQQEAERKAAEEKAAQEKAAKEKAEKEKAEAEKKKAAKQAEVQKTQAEPTNASVDDLTLLAAIIELEAGSHYEGGIAVGNVVLNRVHSSSYPNTISGVIYQRGQFPGAHNGKLAKILARGPKSSSYNAAQAALNGENVVGGRLHFNMQSAINYNKVSNYVLIGGNCFY